MQPSTRRSHRPKRTRTARTHELGWLRTAGDDVLRILRRAPYAGAGLASGGALALAMWTGAGELVIAGVVGYVAYRVFKDGTSIEEGVQEGIRLAKGDPSPRNHGGHGRGHAAARD